MAYEDEVASLEDALIALIEDVRRRGFALESGLHKGLSIDSTTTKTELTTSHNAIDAAFTAYDNARTTWFNALPP